MTEIKRIAIDTSKSVFTLHGVDDAGRAVLRRNLRRGELLRYFEKLPRAGGARGPAGGRLTWGRGRGGLGPGGRRSPPKMSSRLSSAAKTDRKTPEATAGAP